MPEGARPSELAVREGEQRVDARADHLELLDREINLGEPQPARGVDQVEARAGAVHERDAGQSRALLRDRARVPAHLVVAGGDLDPTLSLDHLQPRLATGLRELLSRAVRARLIDV